MSTQESNALSTHSFSPLTHTLNRFNKGSEQAFSALSTEIGSSYYYYLYIYKTAPQANRGNYNFVKPLKKVSQGHWRVGNFQDTKTREAT